MAGDSMGGRLSVGGGAQSAGAFAGGGAAPNLPAPPQANPAVFDTPGQALYGIPSGVTEVTVEAWGGGGGGSKGSGATFGGDGGGGGSYAKYTLGAPLIVSGGVLQVTVAAGGGPNLNGGFSLVAGTDHAVNVTCNGGVHGSGSAKGGVAVENAGAGLTVITNTNGGDAAGHVGKAGSNGGTGGGPGGGAGGAGGADTKAGSDGEQPGGGGGGNGAGLVTPAGSGGAGKVVISHA
jgi:hypothetical protein